jgi:succinate dehydrogenase/fumarate reductase flavoprotein subunit
MSRNVEHVADEVVTTDFLIVGGGLGGCMAAIVAREKGNIDVAIMEKQAIKTSGEVIGLDHYPIMHPVISGFEEGQLEMFRGQYAGLSDIKLMKVFARNSVKPVAVLDGIGVKLREDDGTLKMISHRRQEGDALWSKPAETDEPPKGDLILYRGADLKAKLSRAAIKSGARVFERTIMTGLITRDGTVVGATGVNMRTGKFLVFKAKSVLLSTGGMQRMYSYPYAPFPSNLFYSFNSPANHGGGVVAAYRAGAKLANMEFVHVGMVSAGVPGGGGMFWKMQNSEGGYIEEKYPDVNMVEKGGFFPPTVLLYMPDMHNPEIAREVYKFDASGATEDEIANMYFSNGNEAPNLLKWNKARGNPRTAPPLEIRELTVSLAWGFSGVLAVNDRAETSLKNLFVAGDGSSGTGGAMGYNGPGALIWGYLIAEHVREAVAETRPPVFGAGQVEQVEAERRRVMAPLGRRGDNPLELEDYVRKINNHYIYVYKTEPRLMRAIELHRIARERFVPALGAKNPHELMRCLEVQDIVDLSEIHAYASLVRKESRLEPCHYRVDYPKRDDENWRKSIVIEKDGSGKMRHLLETRE